MIELEEGEVICARCEGAGCLPSTIDAIDILQETCLKCNGKGKLDWISNAMGTRKRKLAAQWTIENDISPTFCFSDEVITKMSEALAKEIDKQILDSIIAEAKNE